MPVDRDSSNDGGGKEQTLYFRLSGDINQSLVKSKIELLIPSSGFTFCFRNEEYGNQKQAEGAVLEPPRHTNVVHQIKRQDSSFHTFYIAPTSEGLAVVCAAWCATFSSAKLHLEPLSSLQGWRICGVLRFFCVRTSHPHHFALFGRGRERIVFQVRFVAITQLRDLGEPPPPNMRQPRLKAQGSPGATDMSIRTPLLPLKPWRLGVLSRDIRFHCARKPAYAPQGGRLQQRHVPKAGERHRKSSAQENPVCCQYAAPSETSVQIRVSFPFVFSPNLVRNNGVAACRLLPPIFNPGPSIILMADLETTVVFGAFNQIKLTQPHDNILFQSRSLGRSRHLVPASKLFCSIWSRTAFAESRCLNAYAIGLSSPCPHRKRLGSHVDQSYRLHWDSTRTLFLINWNIGEPYRDSRERARIFEKGGRVKVEDWPASEHQVASSRKLCSGPCAFPEKCIHRGEKVFHVRARSLPEEVDSQRICNKLAAQPHQARGKCEDAPARQIFCNLFFFLLDYMGRDW
ncbi:hypothetical protein FJTKL_15377 [Diaporthe vaccinii]|uniref:Uncharacterized protein n=1 Tax=Diaporthe vaccinii TaxID=105482 RepID=A0ABR4E545_9PEZI